jgi:hypothetical protein
VNAGRAMLDKEAYFSVLENQPLHLRKKRQIPGTKTPQTFDFFDLDTIYEHECFYPNIDQNTILDDLLDMEITKIYGAEADSGMAQPVANIDSTIDSAVGNHEQQIFADYDDNVNNVISLLHTSCCVRINSLTITAYLKDCEILVKFVKNDSVMTLHYFDYELLISALANRSAFIGKKLVWQNSESYHLKSADICKPLFVMYNNKSYDVGFSNNKNLRTWKLKDCKQFKFNTRELVQLLSTNIQHRINQHMMFLKTYRPIFTLMNIAISAHIKSSYFNDCFNANPHDIETCLNNDLSVNYSYLYANVINWFHSILYDTTPNFKNNLFHNLREKIKANVTNLRLSSTVVLSNCLCAQRDQIIAIAMQQIHSRDQTKLCDKCWKPLCNGFSYCVKDY